MASSPNSIFEVLQSQISNLISNIQNQINQIYKGINTVTANTSVTLTVNGETLMAGTSGSDVTIGDVLLVGNSLPDQTSVLLSNTTNSTSPTTGALVVDGGVAILKQFNIGGSVNFQNGFTATGTIMGPSAVVTSVTTNMLTISGSGVGSSALSIGSSATIDKNGNIKTSGGLTVGSVSNLKGGITANKFTVDTSGDVLIPGNLSVTGVSTLSGATLSGTLTSPNFTVALNGNINTNGSFTSGLFTQSNNTITTNVGTLQISSATKNVNFNSNEITNAILTSTSNTVAANILQNGSIWKVGTTGSAPVNTNILTAQSSSTVGWGSTNGDIPSPGTVTANSIAVFGGNGGNSLLGTGITIDSNQNLYMSSSTLTSNNINKGGNLFISDYGTNNTLIGQLAISSGDTGSNISVISNNPYYDNHILAAGASNCVGMGNGVLYGNITSYNQSNDSVAIGLGALASSGNNSIAIGSNVASGIFNNDIVAIGTQILYDPNLYSPSSCVYIGNHVNQGGGSQSLTISNNVGVGCSVLYSSSVKNCIALGVQAGYNLDDTSYCIMIGNKGISGDTGLIRIGSTQSSAYIAGIYNANIGVIPPETVYINSSGQIGTSFSSRKYKENIYDMKDRSNDIYKLRPVTFKYKNDETKRKQYGLIAEEVHKVLPNLVINDKDGDIYSVSYHTLIPMLLNELKKQDEIIRKQTERLVNLEIK